MKFRIKKNFKGEEYHFWFMFDFKGNHEFRQFMGEDWVSCTLSDDCEWITIQKPITLYGYVNGIGKAPEKEFTKFKVNKWDAQELRMENRDELI